MPAYARRHIVAEDPPWRLPLHRSLRPKSVLPRTDSYTGRYYSHRKAWGLDRLRQLTGLFGIEVCSYAVMSNNLYVVLRNRPNKGFNDPTG
jgi:putative transposase